MNTEFTTKVKVNVRTLEEVVMAYRQDFAAAPTGSNKSRVANSKGFLEKINGVEDTRTFHVKSAASGNTIRLYNTPSVTSLPKNVRKAIVPVKDENHFLFFDVKSAEYMFMAFHAKSEKIIERYRNGDDVYAVSSRRLKSIPRDKLKTVMIASLYDSQPYSAAKVLGCSETEAEYILEEIHNHHPWITDLMDQISTESFQRGMYFYPKSIGGEKIYVPPKEDKKHSGVSRAGALSTFGQSGFAYLFNKAFEVVHQTQITSLPIFDAMVLEVPNDQLIIDGLKATLRTYMDPFILEFREGKTFYEAYVKD